MSDHIISDGHTKSFKFGSIVLELIADKPTTKKIRSLIRSDISHFIRHPGTKFIASETTNV